MNTQTIISLTLLVIALTVPVMAKTESTLCSPEKVANARRNIERYDWARAIRDSVLAAGGVYADQSDDFLWELVTPQDIPRGTQVNRAHGCPRCGKSIERFGTYPWKCDVIRRPWKIECPSCHAIFPKNDFAKFYESGKDENGVFRAELADRSLLFNTEHPDPRDPLHTYGVDDGLGWKDDKGNVYRFIGYYGHYGSWAAATSAIRLFKDAYIYTGDPIYARKAGLMLYRMAQFYPDMDWSKWSKLGFSNSDGGSGMGKVYGRIWEMNIANSMLSAYDAVYPALDDPALLEYLSKKCRKRVDAAAVRALIEKNIVHEVHDAILKRQILGNEGMHQSSMAMAAVVLDKVGATSSSFAKASEDKPHGPFSASREGKSREWLDWIFADGDLRNGDAGGGNIARLFNTRIDEDGMGDEASPMYNGLWRKTFRNISEVLDNYPEYRGRRFRDFPKYRKMFETPVRLICLDKFIPNIGDCGKTGAPYTSEIAVDELVYAYRTFGDPLFAQMAYYLNGSRVDGIRGGIFDEDPESITRAIRDVIKKHGPYVPKTENLSSYGLALLRSGEGEHARALTLYYGRNTGHGHKDTLNIELFGLGLNLMPDIGYPEHATVWAPRYEWTSNTISHNTVVVDRTKQRPSHSGKARFVEQGKGAAACEVYADKVYPQTSIYQRTISMIDVSPEDFYVVDIFRVKGGKEQHYSLHGAEGDVQTFGLNLVEQKSGTLAGEDVPLGKDLGGKEERWPDASGFQYLYNVKRDANPAEITSVEWKVKDTWHVLPEPKDIRLRVSLIDPPGELVLAHGNPPPNRQGNPEKLTYMIATNKGDEATFVSVIEPYCGSRIIENIERIDSDGAVVLKIKLSNGRTDYVVSAVEPMKVKIDGKWDFSGRFGVLSETGDQVEEKVVVR